MSRCSTAGLPTGVLEGELPGEHEGKVAGFAAAVPGIVGSCTTGDSCDGTVPGTYVWVHRRGAACQTLPHQGAPVQLQVETAMTQPVDGCKVSAGSTMTCRQDWVAIAQSGCCCLIQAGPPDVGRGTELVLEAWRCPLLCLHAPCQPGVMPSQHRGGRPLVAVAPALPADPPARASWPGSPGAPICQASSGG